MHKQTAKNLLFIFIAECFLSNYDKERKNNDKWKIAGGCCA